MAVGCCQGEPLHAVLSLASFHVLHWLFSAAPESSNVCLCFWLVGALASLLFRSLSSCLHSVADKSSSIKASASSAPFKGKPREFTGTDWSPSESQWGPERRSRTGDCGGKQQRSPLWLKSQNISIILPSLSLAL